MLPDVGHDDGVAAGLAPEVVDHVRGVEVPAVGQVLDVADGRIALQVRDAREPLGVLAGWHDGHELGENLRQVADERHVDLDVLVDLGGIDLDVDLLRVRRIGLEVAGDTVVEPHAEREQEVGLLDGRVDPGLAVHAHHAQVQRVARGNAADAEQRHRQR